MTSQTIFNIIVALGFLLQGIALMALFRRFRDLSLRIESLSENVTKQVEVLAGKADGFLDIAKGVAEQIQSVQKNVSAITDVVHNRVVEVDAFLSEATDGARLQIARLQDVVDTTSRRIEETIDILQNVIAVPIAEIQAVIRGISTGLDVPFGWRRRSTSRSHQDDEMFI